MGDKEYLDYGDKMKKQIAWKNWRQSPCLEEIDKWETEKRNKIGKCNKIIILYNCTIYEIINGYFKCFKDVQVIYAIWRIIFGSI